MNRSVWVLSVFIAIIFLLYAGPISDRYYPRDTAVPALSQSEPITPDDRKEIEALVFKFTNNYYTYTQESYFEKGRSLLPLLAVSYRETYEKLLDDSYSAVQAVKAESAVLSTQILAVEKNSANTGFTYVHFKAKVANNGKETLNRYSTTLSLVKEEGQWRISGILAEQPVEFTNLNTLL